MAVIVTKPVATPTNLSSSLSAGGDLEADTQYYYIVIGYDILYTTAGNDTRTPFFSDISEEGTFTTTSVNKTVTINWDNSAGANYYNVILTTSSGVYNTTGCGMYSGVARETIGTITDGVVGVEISARSTDVYVHHSVQLVNPMHQRISDDLGLIWVTFDGGTYTLDQVYTAIVDAGYSAYVDYDGYNFVLKGWIYVESTMTTVGLFYAENKRITMLKGGIKNRSPEGDFVFRFGRYSNDLIGGNPNYGCSIDCQGSRYTFMGSYNGSLLVYDCYISLGKSRTTRYGGEWGNLTYFNGGSGSFFYRNISGFATSVLNGTGRSTNSTISDIKYGAGNNWPNNNMIRLDIWSSPNMPYGENTGRFYNCTWNIFSGTFNIHIFSAEGFHYTNMYDCKFPSYPDGMISNPYMKYRVSHSLTSPNYIMNNYSLDMTVLNEEGNPLEGINVSAVDGNGDSVEWIEQDGSNDRLVTGTTYTTDRTTDVNGEIFYYLKAYKNYLNPDNIESIGGYSYDTMKDNYYPYTITFSKSGYRSYTIKIETLNESVKGIITLEYLDNIVQEMTSEIADAMTVALTPEEDLSVEIADGISVTLETTPELTVEIADGITVSTGEDIDGLTDDELREIVE